MGMLWALLGLAIVVFTLVDAFETVLAPRSMGRSLRLERLIVDVAWRLWARIATRFRHPQRREHWLSTFGPSALAWLTVWWAALLVFGFGLIHWGLQTPITGHEGRVPLDSYLYLSGTTFFTLGFGDFVPHDTMGRFLAVAQSGLGFAFLAGVIGYLPVLYQGFSRRESLILVLEARAGMPPTATQILCSYAKDPGSVTDMLSRFEHWAARLLENSLSHPVISYYRSQSERHSWVQAIALMLDTCALLSLRFDREEREVRHIQTQAALTYGLMLNLVKKLCAILGVEPCSPRERLSDDDVHRMAELFQSAGVSLRLTEGNLILLERVRSEYEPYLEALARHLVYGLPRWAPDPSEGS